MGISIAFFIATNSSHGRLIQGDTIRAKPMVLVSNHSLHPTPSLCTQHDSSISPSQNPTLTAPSNVVTLPHIIHITSPTNTPHYCTTTILRHWTITLPLHNRLNRRSIYSSPNSPTPTNRLYVVRIREAVVVEPDSLTCQPRQLFNASSPPTLRSRTTEPMAWKLCPSPFSSVNSGRSPSPPQTHSYSSALACS